MIHRLIQRYTYADLVADRTLVFGWHERLEESVARNKELFVRGLISFSDLEWRLEKIFKDHPEASAR